MITAKQILDLIESSRMDFNRASRYGNKVRGKETETGRWRDVSYYDPFAPDSFDTEKSSRDRLDRGVELMKMPNAKRVNASIWKHDIAPVYGPKSKRMNIYNMTTFVVIHPKDWDEMEAYLKNRYGSFDYFEDQHGIITGVAIGNIQPRSTGDRW